MNYRFLDNYIFLFMATIDNHFQCGENERDKSYRNDEGVNRYVNSWYD